MIRTDLAYTGMRVRVLAHHAGISFGYYGTSHHATEDVAILRSIAGVIVVAPCDARSLDAALRQTVGPPTHLYRHYGLDAPGILARIRTVTAARG